MCQSIGNPNLVSIHEVRIRDGLEVESSHKIYDLRSETLGDDVLNDYPNADFPELSKAKQQ
jgi:hypothetical protein